MKIGILFDLDGTLLDTLGDLTDATNYALRQFGFAERSEAEIRSFVGNGARNLIVQAMGVAENELQSIFERFYRADQARGGESGGHGLGLSIARIIIRAHGGKIEVQSKPGVGSRFHILLPL